MFYKKSILPILAVIVGVAASAFTVTPSQMDSDLVWFEVSPNGTVLNPTDGGEQGDQNPYGCTFGDTLCARAFSISEQEVVENQDGTYGIAQDTDTQHDFNATAKKD